MLFFALAMLAMIFVPVYKNYMDPTIYGAKKKKKSKMSGESIKRQMAAKSS